KTCREKAFLPCGSFRRSSRSTLKINDLTNCQPWHGFRLPRLGFLRVQDGHCMFRLPSLLLRRSVALAAMAAALSFMLAAPASATSRIKDIVDVEGIRDNLLVGYGLVVGLNGTGDTLRNTPFTQQSLTAM